MSQAVWICVATVGMMGMTALVTMEDGASVSEHVSTPLVMQPVTPTTGRALSAAAFGLDALQPETYDPDLVLELIDASPLQAMHKLELAESLEAAGNGKAELDTVLKGVRTALNVE